MPNFKINVQQAYSLYINNKYKEKNVDIWGSFSFRLMQFSKENLQTTVNSTFLCRSIYLLLLIQFGLGSVISLLHFTSLFPSNVLSLSLSDLIVSEPLNKVSCFSPDQAVVLQKVPWIYLLDMYKEIWLNYM